MKDYNTQSMSRTLTINCCVSCRISCHTKTLRYITECRIFVQFEDYPIEGHDVDCKSSVDDDVNNLSSKPFDDVVLKIYIRNINRYLAVRHRDGFRMWSHTLEIISTRVLSNNSQIPNIHALISETHSLFLSILILNSQCVSGAYEVIDIWYIGVNKVGLTKNRLCRSTGIFS